MRFKWWDVVRRRLCKTERGLSFDGVKKLVWVFQIFLVAFGIFSKYKQHFTYTPIACGIGVLSLFLSRYLVSHANLPNRSPVLRQPAHILQIFLLVIPKRNREHIIGDLEEEYRTSHKSFPRLWYSGEVIVIAATYLCASLKRLAGFDSILKMIRK